MTAQDPVPAQPLPGSADQDEDGDADVVVETKTVVVRRRIKKSALKSVIEQAQNSAQTRPPPSPVSSVKTSATSEGSKPSAAAAIAGPGSEVASQVASEVASQVASETASVANTAESKFNDTESSADAEEPKEEEPQPPAKVFRPLAHQELFAYIGLVNLVASRESSDLEALIASCATPVKTTGSWFGSKSKPEQTKTEIINAYNQWVKRLLSDLFTENVFSEPERRMIVDLAEHGITVSDLTSTLQKALKKHLEGETGQETDSISTVKSLEYIGDRLSIAYSIVFNLIFSVIKVEANQVGELRYDARLRSLAKNITARIFNITERLYTEAEALEAKKGIEAEAASELKGVSDEVATEATETTGAATIEASEEHNGDGDGDADSGIESVDDGKNAAADPQDEQDVSTDIDRLSVDSQEKKWKIRSLFQQDVERLVAEETRKAFPWMSVVRPVSYCFTEANFEVVPLTPQRRSIHCILAVSGWLHAGEKLKEAWSSLLGICPFSEVDMIMFDRNQLIQISNAIRDFMATGGTYVPEDELTKQSKMTSLTTKTMWPRSLLDMSYLVDKPWKAALARTEAAGIVLAKNLLMGPVRGTRPVTLVGWGLGARVIYHCLLEMVGHARADGPNPWGIIDSVYMLGCPVEVAGKDMIDITTLVSDRFVNVFSHKDWFLQFLSRNLSPSAALFGLRPVSARGAGPAIAEGTRIKLGRIENYEVSDIVHRHLDYQEELPTILQRIGFDRDSYEASTVVTVGPPA